ncbi:MAG: AAA family ATPase [Clostridia bacterium]|nr:AAA family ATPase [Clostridia bacterium]
MGKSTVAANLAMALARRGRRVLLADCDFEMRCLDLVLGVENEIIYDIFDLAKGRIPLERALLTDARSPNLHFLAAPFQHGGEITADEFRKIITEAADSDAYDVILLDTPGQLNIPAVLDSRVADSAIIVASHQPSSIRAAGQTGEFLARQRISWQRLLINSFDFDGALGGSRPGINEIIDRSFIQLCGIVPYERALMIAAETGELACQLKNSMAAAAFDNIAARLCGQYVPLFHGFHGMKVRGQIKRLLAKM